jgi:hypothetical protein
VAGGNDDIIKPVIPPKRLGQLTFGIANHSVVVAVARIIAPCLKWAGWLNSHPCKWPGHPVGAVEHSSQVKSPDRGCTISLSLTLPASITTEKAGKDCLAKLQPALDAAA